MALQRAPAAIRVGMTASLSGRYHPQGQQALLGVQTWVDDTNRHGGIQVGTRRLPLHLRFYDDGSDAAQCGSLAERLLVTDQVDLFLGPYSSGLTLRAAAVAERYQRVLWNHGGALEAEVEPATSWVINLLTPASVYFHGVIDLVCQNTPGVTRAAIVHSTAGAFPKTVAAGAERYSLARGFSTVQTYPYPPRTTNFTALLTRLMADQPQLILSVGRIEDDLQFAVQYVRHPVPQATVALIATPLTLFHTTLGQAASTFLGPSQWEPGLVTCPDYGPTPTEVLQRLRARAPAGVDYPMAQAYAGGLVAQRCLEVAGTLDPQHLCQVAQQLDFTTFYGRYHLDPSSGRQIGHRMPVVQWQGELKVIRWPMPM